MPRAPDCLFPAESTWGIPILDLARQATHLDAPILPWGSIGRRRVHRGSYHFYTEDRKFKALWENPGHLPLTECRTAVELNFSTNTQTPAAAALWDVYRKRWVAAYWQSMGVRVAVDINVEERFADLNLLGVPRGWSAYATRATDADLATLKAQHERAIDHANGNSMTMLVYCGGHMVRAYCEENRLLYLPFHVG